MGVTNCTHSTHPRSRLYFAIPWPDAPVIYTGAFPILTARPGHGSIYNTMQRIQKELDESNGNYKGMAAWKPYSNGSDKNLLVRSRPWLRTISTSQAGSKLWIWECPSFFIRQVVHEDIHYFSYKMRKGKFLSQAMKDKRKDNIEKLLNKFKHPF